MSVSAEVEQTDAIRFTSVRFKNYKALRSFSISLTRLNILVGPNNAGKSTILGAFRILTEGLRRARARSPEMIRIQGINELAYRVNLTDLPISTENIFTDYNDAEPASVIFKLSNGNELELIFPEIGNCILRCRNAGRSIKSPSDFRRAYPVTVGHVPVLGPVEQNERLYEREAARNALLSHSASRNFRNIWRHFPDGFEDFQLAIRTTWPGMDINRPTVEYRDSKAYLAMNCPEKRYPREIFWAGFGFQVWCQMLTYILRSQQDSLLIIDEPDIYLHSDLQRQLVGIIRGIRPDVLLATHSTEIITEADPTDLLIVNKSNQSAQRLKDASGLQKVFDTLKSALNPTLTQLAKTRRALFVEGKDFKLVSDFARILNKGETANRADFAVVPVDGFNPQRVVEFSKGMELTLGAQLLKAVVFDRDYRCEDDVNDIKNNLKSIADFVHVHKRKELENYLLVSRPLEAAIRFRLREKEIRGGASIKFDESVEDVLADITDELKHDVAANITHRAEQHAKIHKPNIDPTTIRSQLMREFESNWKNLSTRLCLVPGKEVLAKLNQHLQTRYQISITHSVIVRMFKPDEIPEDLRNLINALDAFRTKVT